jgi:hypothetical protein
MDNRPHVVLLGNSLLLDGVAVSLMDQQRLRMVRLEAGTSDIREQLGSLEPELIVFELDSPDAHSIISLLKDRPGILLIGLDLNCSRAIVLNSSQHLTRSMSDLQRVVLETVNLKALASQRDGFISDEKDVVA